MIRFFLRNGREVELPTATAVCAEAFGAAVACYDAAWRLLGRFLLDDVLGYVVGRPELIETPDWPREWGEWSSSQVGWPDSPSSSAPWLDNG
jgi:hypothetical protein